MSAPIELEVVLDTARRKMLEPSPVDQALGRELLELALEMAKTDAPAALERVAELRAEWLDRTDLVGKLADYLEGATHDAP